MTIDAIRQRFPRPCTAGTFRGVPASEVPAQVYCVGTALCHVAGLACLPPFPPAMLVRDALMRLNPALTIAWAMTYAEALLRANEARYFDDAWEIASTALSVGP
jgi:hypothetical protein